MNHQNNITRIKAIDHWLGDLRSKVVFVGGATISLYADRETSEVRPTDDIDILIELWSYAAFAEVENQLRKMGFTNDSESKIICRYKIQGIIVDIIPTGKDVLGFSNKWYPEGFKYAINYRIDEHQTVKIFSPPYFLATKIEAFKNRGKNDGRTSTDFEDIVFLLENRLTIWDELEHCMPELKEYLKKEFKKFLANKYLSEWISCHIDFEAQPNITLIIGRLRKFAFS
jgi:predicted nucleotidyltransferase